MTLYKRCTASIYGVDNFSVTLLMPDHNARLTRKQAEELRNDLDQALNTSADELDARHAATVEQRQASPNRPGLVSHEEAEGIRKAGEALDA